MKIEKIIEAIEMLKSDFKARYGVEANTCILSEDLYMKLFDHYKKKVGSGADLLSVKTVCRAKIIIDNKTFNNIQVGYFSKPCCVDCEME